MPSLAELGLDLTDREEVLNTFQIISRQVFYMALFENEDMALNFFEEEPTEEDENSSSPLHAFSQHLFQTMSENFLPPEDLTLEEWAKLAEEVKRELTPETNLPALAQKIYHLLRQEIKIERERQIRAKSW
jgi:hypothetical protein